MVCFDIERSTQRIIFIFVALLLNITYSFKLRGQPRVDYSILVRSSLRQSTNFACQDAADTIHKDDTSVPYSIFIFGLGYVGSALAEDLKQSGWKVSGTSTNIKKVNAFRSTGINAYLFDHLSGPIIEQEAIDSLLKSTHILSTIPPEVDSGTDPVLSIHGPEIRLAALQPKDDSSLKWIGYLSSTGVYGDCDGAWVFEETPIRPRADNSKALARARAEGMWHRLFSRSGLPVHIFRLSGIYGPGRNAIDSLVRAKGDLAACLGSSITSKKAQDVISRVHLVDIVDTLKASLKNPNPGLLVNVADDLPSSRFDSFVYAHRLLEYPTNDLQKFVKSISASTTLDSAASLSSSSASSRGGSKRVDNSLMRALLNRQLTYPDYRSGLQAIKDALIPQSNDLITNNTDLSPNIDADVAGTTERRTFMEVAESIDAKLNIIMKKLNIRDDK